MNDCLNVLKAAREAELEVCTLLEEIEQLHKIMRLPGRPLERVKRLSEQLAELEELLNGEIDAAVDRKREAMKVLSALCGAEKAVLYQYYIMGLDWADIADKLFYSERQIYNIRKRAVEKLTVRYKKAS